MLYHQTSNHSQPQANRRWTPTYINISHYSGNLQQPRICFSTKQLCIF